MSERTVGQTGIWAAALMALVLGGAGLFGWWWQHCVGAAMPVTPLEPPERGLRVFHLGHSLVGRDMPAMVEQLAHAAGHVEHDHHSQLGWGTTLRAHWEPSVEVNGFEAENDHDRFLPAREAIESGVHDAVILTEKVELRDALRWHDGARYLHTWARAARAARPDARLYLYETWHPREDPDAWLNRLETDAATLWEGQLLARASTDPAAWPVHVVPAGRVMAAFVRALRERNGVEGMSDESSLFRRTADGMIDPIHLGDAGNYLVALTHVAVLYHQAVEGLPHDLLRADGSPTDPLSDEAALLMQRVVWQVVQGLAVTGLARSDEPGGYGDKAEGEE